MHMRAVVKGVLAFEVSFAAQQGVKVPARMLYSCGKVITFGQSSRSF
jgi:hypothetical protein